MRLEFFQGWEDRIVGGGELCEISIDTILSSQKSVFSETAPAPELVCAPLEIKLPCTGKSMQAAGHCCDERVPWDQWENFFSVLRMFLGALRLRENPLWLHGLIKKSPWESLVTMTVCSRDFYIWLISMLDCSSNQGN